MANEAPARPTKARRHPADLAECIGGASAGRKKASNRHESPPRGAAHGRGVGLWRIPQTMEYAADRAEHTLCEDAAG